MFLLLPVSLFVYLHTGLVVRAKDISSCFFLFLRLLLQQLIECSQTELRLWKAKAFPLKTQTVITADVSPTLTGLSEV